MSIYREDYVELLKKHIDVDVFGACGDLKCGREEDHNTKDCDLMLERDYRLVNPIKCVARNWFVHLQILSFF